MPGWFDVFDESKHVKTRSRLRPLLIRMINLTQIVWEFHKLSIGVGVHLNGRNCKESEHEKIL